MSSIPQSTSLFTGMNHGVGVSSYAAQLSVVSTNAIGGNYLNVPSYASQLSSLPIYDYGLCGPPVINRPNFHEGMSMPVTFGYPYKGYLDMGMFSTAQQPCASVCKETVAQEHKDDVVLMSIDDGDGEVASDCNAKETENLSIANYGTLPSPIEPGTYKSGSCSIV